MNGIVDKHMARDSEIIIRVWFVDGDSMTQPMTSNELDGVQELMDWWRDSKRGPIWTWHVVNCAKIHMLNRSQITLITIEGYVEPEMNKVKWYQRLADKWRVHIGLKGGGRFEKIKRNQKEAIKTSRDR